MATAAPPAPVHDDAESVSVIWLDTLVHTSRVIVGAVRNLRTSIHALKTFEKPDECEHYIRSASEQGRTILIVGGRLGQEIVPRIHQFPQVTSIYVYCLDKKKNEEWARPFVKVKGVVVDINDLVAQVLSDHKKHSENQIEEPLFFNVFNTNVDDNQLIMDDNINFVYSQLFIDCFLRMHSSADDKKNLIGLCTKQYNENEDELNIVREFEQDYLPKQALWWYTRKSFLYRMLNNALRMQSIEKLFLLRFFIRDLAQQITKNKCTSPLRVFQGQLISHDELELLKKSVGEYVSIKTFFSTTTNAQGAYAGHQQAGSPKHLARVLFEIEADPRLNGIKPFANITQFSFTPDTEEVLFMPGSIFRIAKAHHHHHGIWVVQLILSSDNDQRLKPILEPIKNQYSDGEMDVFSLGNILLNLKKLDQVEKYYRRLIRELADDGSAVAKCYYILGNLHRDKKNEWEALDSHHKALALREKHLPDDHLDLGRSHSNIGMLHWCAARDDLALEHFTQALQIFKKSLPPDHLLIARTVYDIGLTYEAKNEFQEALSYFEKSVVIFRQKLPPTDPNVVNNEQKIQKLQSQLH